MPTTSYNTWNKIQITHYGLQPCMFWPDYVLTLSLTVFPIATQFPSHWGPVCTPVQAACSSLSERLLSQDLVSFLHVTHVM